MIVDLFLIYQFIKKLATPFKEWEAYKLGIIDEKGKQLKKRKDLRSQEEKSAFGLFDLMISKLKKLIEKIPGGQTRLGTYAAALYLIKEHNDIENYSDDMLTEDFLNEKLHGYMTLVETMQANPSVEKMMDEIFSEDAPANSAGSGNIAGIGVGPDGEPGVSKKKQKEIQQKNKDAVLRRMNIRKE